MSTGTIVEARPPPSPSVRRLENRLPPTRPLEAALPPAARPPPRIAPRTAAAWKTGKPLPAATVEAPAAPRERRPASVEVVALSSSVPRSVDMLEALFGTSMLKVASDRPRLVVAVKPLDPVYEYLELLKRVLVEVYRVAARMPLAPQHVARRLTEYQLATMRGGGAVYAIDVDAVAEAEPGGTGLSRLTRTLEDRARETYAQGFGFLVLYTSQSLLARVREVWRPRLAGRGVLYTTAPAPLTVKVAEAPEAIRLVEAMYGLREGALGDASSLDAAAVAAEAVLARCLESTASDPVLGRLVSLAADDEEARPDDAFLHYALKSLAVAYLLEAGFRETSIDTEVSISNMPVDVLARKGWGNGIIVEAETLHGTINPVSRLSTVLRSRMSLGYDVWIVLHPLTASIYSSEIGGLVREYSEYESVRLMTVDASRCTLIDLEEHYNRLRKLAEQLSARRGKGEG